MRRIPWLIVLGILGVAMVTLLISMFGPAPFIPAESRLLTQEGATAALNEPSDRLILISWVVIAISLAAAGIFSEKRGEATNNRLQKVRKFSSTFHLGLLATSVVILIWSITWSGHLWSGIQPLGLLVGVLATALVALCWIPSWPAARVYSLLLGTAVVSFALPALLQLPGSIRDVHHFQFTSDDLAAPGAGYFPLSDFTSQYSNLLGWPIAPFLELGIGVHLVIVAWILFLQVISIVIAVSFPVLVGGRRFLAPAIAVVLAPILAVNSSVIPVFEVANSGEGLLSASTYFQVMPLRVVLPSIVLLSAFLILRRKPELTRRATVLFALLGVAMGLTILNNPDYGLPSAVAVAVATLMSTKLWRPRLVALAIQTMGLALAFLTYSVIGFVSGNPINWEYWLLFQRVFGSEGFVNEPIQPFGLHIAVVSLFIGSVLAGTALLIRYRSTFQSAGRREGLALVLVGVWSLTSLPYFSGRSYGATLVGGYAFMIGLNVAAFLPAIRRSFRIMHAKKYSKDYTVTAASVLGIIAIAGAIAFAGQLRSPVQYFNVVSGSSLSYSTVAAKEESYVEFLKSDSIDAGIRSLVEQGKVGQALNNASLVALITGMAPVGAVKMPDFYIPWIASFADIQCESKIPIGIELVLVTQAIGILLQANDTCKEVYDFSQRREFANGTVLLPVRRK